MEGTRRGRERTTAGRRLCHHRVLARKRKGGNDATASRSQTSAIRGWYRCDLVGIGAWHDRLGAGVRGVDWVQWGGQPGAHDDAGGVPRRRRALRHGLQVPGRRRPVRHAHPAARVCRPAWSAAGRGRSSGWCAKRRHRDWCPSRPRRRRRLAWRCSSRRASTRSISPCSRVAAPMSPSGPTSTVSHSRLTPRRCSTSTPSAVPSSWPRSSTAMQPSSADSRSATERQSTSRYRSRIRGCHCASWAWANNRRTASTPTCSC